jgi:hypothetical protein
MHDALVVVVVIALLSCRCCRCCYCIVELLLLSLPSLHCRVVGVVIDNEFVVVVVQRRWR